MWREIKSSPVAMADMSDDLKHGNKFYTGVETDRGVLLFSRDHVGERQCNVFLVMNVSIR